jgi:SAM-dependent methyltransferase
MDNLKSKDYLWLNLKDLPYFRALLRAVEAGFYQDFQLPSPVLDLGCGDGHFASITFEKKIDVGLDPWLGPLRQAKQRGNYLQIFQSDGANMPFPDEYFASAFSNSVLEHIPALDPVLREMHRVLKRDASFLFCVPNHNFLPSLSIGKALDRLGLKSLGNRYRGFFNWISRHQHCDTPETWQKRLAGVGFQIEQWWHYFPPEALKVLEWGHYWGAPTLLPHFILRRWIWSPTRWNLALTERMLRPWANSRSHPQGTYTFYVAKRV